MQTSLYPVGTTPTVRWLHEHPLFLFRAGILPMPLIEDPTVCALCPDVGT